jgi:hypothetical protein
MRPFRFRLDRVLQWQAEVCQVKENDVRLCLFAVAETEGRIARLEAACVKAEHDVLNQRKLVAADLAALAQFRSRAAAEQKSLSALRAEQRLGLESARERLLAARRQLRLLEKLRERALKIHAIEADREVEALAAEAHTSRWISEASGSRVDLADTAVR